MWPLEGETSHKGWGVLLRTINIIVRIIVVPRTMRKSTGRVSSEQRGVKFTIYPDLPSIKKC